MEKKIHLNIENTAEIVLMSQGETLLQALLKARKDIAHSCGGFGTCGTCQVEVCGDLEKLPGRNDVEAEMATDRGFADHERLACQLIPLQDLKIRLPRG